MRILRFVKIDLIRSKKISWLLLMPALAAVILLKAADTNPIFASFYCLFGGITYGSYPMSEQCAGESGFLEMLPAGKKDRMRAHFLYALLTALLFGFLGVAATVGCSLIRPDISLEYMWTYYPLLLGIALLFTALENAVLCAFHFENAQAQSFLRILPAFLFFFGGLSLSERLPGLVSGLLSWITPMKSLTLFAACLLIFWSIAEMCAALCSRRDEV